MDLFSGIGGFSQGLKQAGYKIKKHLFAEVDKHAQAIYKNQFPAAVPVGDVRHVRGSELGGVDIITFGSPCQDFSLAGKRRGMDGERSSLITEAIRLIDECRPDFFIWENVKGTFSSNGGKDFIAILQAFTNIGGYRLEWQLLNTAWWLPQNRERIYLVGRIAGKCEGQVFPISTSNCKHEKIKNPLKKIKVGDYRNDEGMRWRKDGICPTIPARARQDGSGQPILDMGIDKESIRRLTEIECERLQGFSDNWTQYGNYGGEVKEVSASQRYKCLGNAVTVDVVQAVGKSIMELTV